MKQILIFAVVMLFVLSVSVAYAETTSGANWRTPYSPLTRYLNSNKIDHDHELDIERDPELGLGLDLILYEFEESVNSWGLNCVELQQKFDINNSEYSVYGVLKCNLWTTIKRIME